MVLDAFIHGVITYGISEGDTLPVVAGAVAAACGTAFIGYSDRSISRAAELGMAIFVIPVFLCSVGLIPGRSVFGTTWPGWVYVAIAGASGGLAGGIMATHRRLGMVSGLLAGLGAAAALGLVFEWRPAIPRIGFPRIGFFVFGAVGALPGLGLYYMFTRSSQAEPEREHSLLPREQ